jgi:uncharacterized metal-binding protein YceD (DUF177 family)
MNIQLVPTQQKQDVSIHITEHRVVDIIDIKPFDVTYEIIQKHDQTILQVEGDVDLVLACSKTLKPVDYQVSFNAEVTFGNLDECDFIYTNTINLNDILLGIIVSEKPYVIYHQDALIEESTSS